MLLRAALRTGNQHTEMLAPWHHIRSDEPPSRRVGRLTDRAVLHGREPSLVRTPCLARMG
jgi:hypothetical protein